MNKILFLVTALVLSGRLAAQLNPLTAPMVYHEPAMDKVVIKKGIAYKTYHADTVLRFDIYYPADISKTAKPLPLVIFNNGVGGNQVPEWKIYQDWASLMAAHGMIAINHQSRQGKTDKDLSTLLEHLRTNALELKVDKEKIGIWACSANTPTAWGVANDPQNSFIRAVAIYYGFVPPAQRKVQRQDLEILLVRAGLDSYNLNIGMEELMISALRSDAHVEYLNYPEGQHAFDAVDPTPRSRELILQTVDFFKRNLAGDNSDSQSQLITNRQLSNLIITENKVDEGIERFRTAFQYHNSKFVKYPFWNQLLNENNLNGIGYQLLQMNRVDDALKIFRLNLEYFQESPNVYDALADGFERKGDKENTLKYARLALEKLKTATNISPQFAEAVRASAETKIKTIETDDKHPYQRAHHELVYDDNSKLVLLIGGSTPLNGGQSFRFFNDIWNFDGKSWKKVGHAGDERSGIRTAFDTKRKRLYSFGGFLRDNQSSGQLRMLENGDWRILSDLPEMKAAEPGFVYHEATDQLVAYCATGRDDIAATTWLWDGNTWTKYSGVAPEPRQAFMMGYDSKRKRTVLYGGIGTSQKRFSDTWEFDGKVWRKVTDQGPGHRMAAGATYDSKRGLFVIFGGMSEDGSKNDMWGWNGKEWKQISGDGPPARSMGHLAYDKNRDRIVMFGGRLGWPNDANDTWEWDGVSWREVTNH
jgi:tetratricopeptide (TPR) repeat protein